MAIKRPAGEELKGMLLEGNFGQQAPDELSAADPLTTSQMVLTLDDV